MIRLPKRLYLGSDGWVIRNLREYGDTVFPRAAVIWFRRMYGDDWREEAESTLTQILREQGVIDDTMKVWITECFTMDGVYTARWH